MRAGFNCTASSDPLPLPLCAYPAPAHFPDFSTGFGGQVTPCDKTTSFLNNLWSPHHLFTHCSVLNMWCIFHPKSAEVTVFFFIANKTSSDHWTTPPPSPKNKTKKQTPSPNNTIHAFWLKRAVDIIFRFLFWLVSHLQYPPQIPTSPGRIMCIKTCSSSLRTVGAEQRPREQPAWPGTGSCSGKKGLEKGMQGPKEQETRRWLLVMLMMILCPPL